MWAGRGLGEGTKEGDEAFERGLELDLLVLLLLSFFREMVEEEIVQLMLRVCVHLHTLHVIVSISKITRSFRRELPRPSFS